MRTLIILGSSRKNGETAKIVDEIIKITGWDKIDLNDYQISYYDYEHKNKEDDFLPLMRQIADNYDFILFATPVYWYAMSGIMKVFFDRITDLITIEKPLGRKLRGKSMAVISSSAGGNLAESFWLPFIESANYLGMNYLGNLHTFEEVDETQNVAQFVQMLQAKWA